MAARPGRVAEQVPVTLARPRTQETRISEEFDDYRRRIRQLMQSLDVTRNAAH
jgi:ABC-type nitrate/sulfonate/bicarbonate transport system ATPase subunit